MPNNDNIQTLCDEIQRLKREKDALILAHYYQRLDVQLIADIYGDSFELSKKARLSDKKLAIFCGVSFMAESVKILNPEKTVLLPEPSAGCRMADMVTAADVVALREKYPDAAVVCYVNSSAETKAVSDICCTSSNAVKVVGSLKNKQIIFIPDKNLGAYVAKFLPDKEFILHSGWCPIHHGITTDEVKAAKNEHPGALVTVHPECEPEVSALADYVGSTSQMIGFCEKSVAKEFIVGTEVGVVERLNYYNPDKKFHLLTPHTVCDDMKKTTLKSVLAALRGEVDEVTLTKEQIEAAKLPLERMMQINT